VAGKLRSAGWFGGEDEWTIASRACLRSEGFSSEVFKNRPVIGVCNTWSELANCNAHLKPIAEAVKRGVWAAGGFPLEFPTISLGEPLMKPTTMMFRNLMSMDVEESIRANPIDGVVLLTSCDKTTPAALMGASSVDLPTIVVTGGPQRAGHFRGKPVGSGTDLWKYWDERRKGKMSDEEWSEFENSIVRSGGHCGVMGTASTMSSIVEALGMGLPGCATIPAVDSGRLVLAEESGRRIVQMVKEDLNLSKIMTPQAFANAIRVDMAIGGSTNAIIHFVAMAGRLGYHLPLMAFDEFSRTTPVLANIRPNGQYMMEDFFYAGGVQAVMKNLGDLIHHDVLTVTGKPIGESIKKAAVHIPDVIRTCDNPIFSEGGTVVLFGNLAPDGAIIKQSAASGLLLKHRGRAVVFPSYADYLERYNDLNLDVRPNDILVLQGTGPKGFPGMPEYGKLPLPLKLINHGVTDMVRISDARMSGTGFGTVVLHVTPESRVGGPLAVVRTGDQIELDVERRNLELLISDDELKARLKAWKPPAAHFTRGYGKLYEEHVLQANEGCDFDFLVDKEKKLMNISFGSAQEKPVPEHASGVELPH
jgi:dihydroxy-acid dehydratase